MTDKKFIEHFINRAEEIFNSNKTFCKLLTYDDLNGAVIPSIIEICLLDAFEEKYGSRVMHGAESTGHDIEHRTFKNIAMEVKATSNIKGLTFRQNICNGDDKFPDKDKKINHIFIAFTKDLSSNTPKIFFKKVLFGAVSYNDWHPNGRSMYITKKNLKNNCITIR